MSDEYCECDLITRDAIEKDKTIECSNCHKPIIKLKD